MSFETAAKEILESLFKQIDDLYGDKADVDENSDSLTVYFENDQTWLVNIQLHHQEIWLSSPITGAHHYKLKNNQWINTRDEKSRLNDTLLAELSLAR